MKLSQMKENQCARITDIDDNTPFERRFFDMGFINGQSVICVNIGLFGTPIAYQIRGSKIALRKKDASKIGVVM
jgi:Fe2+ transport system protein FeoA